jgi:hypothetical protein
MAMLDERDRDALRQPVFFEGRADGLRGVGAPRLPSGRRERRPPWARKESSSNGGKLQGLAH